MSTPGVGDRSRGLPVGTRVWKNGETGATARFGVVMPHEPEYSQSGFPVRFDDWIWEKLDVTDVTAVTPQREADIRDTQPERSGKRAS